jgi:hypothetical protein
MKTRLTKRERVLRTIRFEELDRIATYDILENDDVIAHYAGRKPDTKEGTRIKNIAIARCLDMSRMLHGPMEPGGWTDENGFEHQRERWTSWIVKRPFSDLDGLKRFIRKAIQQKKQFRPDSAFRHRFHEQLWNHEAYFAEGAEDPNDLPVMVVESGVGLTEAYHIAGLDLFTMLMVSDRELLEEWLEENLRAELRRVEAIANPELFPVALTNDDIACNTGTIFAPDWLRKSWTPRLKRLVAAWHRRDTYCLFHSDGNLNGVLDDLAGTGIDGLNPIETCAGMSISEVRKRQPRLFMAGGIDVSQLLPLGTPEEVRARCIEAIQEADGKGYFLGSTTEIFPGIPAENAVAMLETPEILEGAA